MMTSGPERSVGPIVTSVLSFGGRASFFLASNSRTSSGEGGGVLADCFGFFSIRKSTSASQARNHRKIFYFASAGGSWRCASFLRRLTLHCSLQLLHES